MARQTLPGRRGLAVPAELLKFADPPDTPGGDAEKEVAERLRTGLPDGYLMLAGFSIPTGRSYFYEYDLVLISPFLLEVLEVKHFLPVVIVESDTLISGGGHEEPQV